MKVSSTSVRLKEIMLQRNLRQIDILELCKPYCEKYNVKIAKNDLSQYISGKVVPKQDKLSILGMALKVDEVWLMGYDLPDPSSTPPLTPEAHQIGVAYDGADERTKTAVEVALGIDFKKESARTGSSYLKPSAKASGGGGIG